MYYADAIEVIVKNGDYASQELRDLEKQALRLRKHVSRGSPPRLAAERSMSFSRSRSSAPV